MQSSLIGKIQKANLYAREPDRVTFREFSTTFRGDNDNHSVSFRNDHWSCDCDFFGANDICTHVMAIQKLLGTMLPSEGRYWPGSGAELAGSSNSVGV